MSLAEFLPAVHPPLPEIRVAEKFGPPCAAEERAGVPLAGIVIASVGRAEGAVEVPMRAADDFPVAGFLEISAQDHGVDVAAEDFEDVEIDCGVNVDVSAVAEERVLPVGAVERAVELVEEGVKIIFLGGSLGQGDDWLLS